MENRQTFLAPHLFEFCLILGILKKLHNFETHVEISDGRKLKIGS